MCKLKEIVKFTRCRITAVNRDTQNFFGGTKLPISLKTNKQSGRNLGTKLPFGHRRSARPRPSVVARLKCIPRLERMPAVRSRIGQPGYGEGAGKRRERPWNKAEMCPGINRCVNYAHLSRMASPESRQREGAKSPIPSFFQAPTTNGNPKFEIRDGGRPRHIFLTKTKPPSY